MSPACTVGLGVDPHRAPDVWDTLRLARRLELETEEAFGAPTAVTQLEAMRVEEFVGEQDRGVGREVDVVPPIALYEAVHREVFRRPALERRRHVSFAAVLLLVEDDAGAVELTVVHHRLVPVGSPLIGERSGQFDCPNAQKFAQSLRMQRPAVVGRISDDVVILDLRTVTDEQIPDFVDAVNAAIRDIEKA